MENFKDLIPLGGMFLFILGSIVAVKVGLEKRPTFTHTDETYQGVKLCEEVHKRVDEHLKCLPEIKESIVRIETKIDLAIRNGKK